MARIRRLYEVSGAGTAHPTLVDCSWRVVPGGEPLLQLSTYGSDDRASEPKVSQTVQFDRSTAQQLREVISRVFPE